MFPLEALAGLSIEDREQAWREAIASPSPRSHIFVAEGEVGVSGFASFGPTRDSDDDPEQVGELYAIYVLPEAWGKGVGRTLMAKLLEHLRADGFRESTLWVLADNPRTRHFYEVAGWKIDGAAQARRASQGRSGGTAVSDQASLERHSDGANCGARCGALVLKAHS